MTTSASASTSEVIHSNAQYHSDLLQTLHSLEYAPSALKEQTRYIADLRTQLKEVKERVNNLALKTKKERKEHEDLRDSLLRRMASTVVGRKEKFEAKKAKEEREYIEALEAEIRERENQKMLEDMIVEAARTKLDIEDKAERLKLVQGEISILYENVFGGPTQEFPRDDQLESQLKSAQETYDSIQAHLNSNSQAVGLLIRAEQMVQFSLGYLNEALAESSSYNDDLYHSSGSYTEVMSSLCSSAASASKAELLMVSARRANPEVQAIPPLRVYDISVLGGVFSDDLYIDAQAYSKVQENKEKLMRAQTLIVSEIKAAKRRAHRAGADLIEASEVLTDCRKELERFRRVTFEQVGGTSASVGLLPPSYESSADGGAPSYSPPSGPSPDAHVPSSVETPAYSPTVLSPDHPDAQTSHLKAPGSVSAPSSPGPSTPSFPSASHTQTQKYPPPPGPPPDHLEFPSLARSHSQTTGASQPKTHAKTLSTSSNKDLPALPTNEPSSSTSGVTNRSQPVSRSSPTPSHVPAHWGSRNPFAASMIEG
ncbi:hypothetical protein D9758_006567 [Tetrapyrgos nigripes]|uniref:Uncharacterized protein n=1 Tax=Tetrapyrgos nigripes TaxID=182062 RepID=A0A8H5GL09_9AGAR|nr:hypothetical protein D9758_006567 [Tetrapyrgos nigripes]